MADKLIVGCGYLGRRVAARWLAEGHRVFGTTRTESRANELRGLGVEPVLSDVLDANQLRSLPAVATILYCVGFDRSAGRSMQQVYVQGLQAFIDAYRGSHGDPGRFIYISSTGVYGQQAGEEVDEEAATSPQEDSGRVVLEAEQVLRTAWNSGPWTILRFAGIYGLGRIIRRQSIAAGEPLVGDADKWLNLIHVEDGAAAVLAAEKSQQIGTVYNVSDDSPVRRRDFYTEMARLLGAPAPRFVPPEPGTPMPPHERANRRVRNRRMREELAVTLQYPSFLQGLRASLTTV